MTVSDGCKEKEEKKQHRDSCTTADSITQVNKGRIENGSDGASTETEGVG